MKTSPRHAANAAALPDTGALSRCAQPALVVELGSMAYAEAFDAQRRWHDAVLALRDRDDPGCVGALLLVEHDPPVITISRRPGAGAHLIATPAQLAGAGVTVEPTDRGGDITYHGPGQLVVYPILDLQRLGQNLHAYMRMLEEIVIRVCAGFGVETRRDRSATGVWVGDAKVCAMGVRIRRWVTMHGLALNVDPEMRHFDLIVPCGLAGRSVTSLRAILGDDAPAMGEVRRAIVDGFHAELTARRK
jgi:lipoate-protein ligase B